MSLLVRRCTKIHEASAGISLGVHLLESKSSRPAFSGLIAHCWLKVSDISLLLGQSARSHSEEENFIRYSTFT